MSLMQMSIVGAVLILAIVVIRAATINKLPKRTFLTLWIIALARLLVPFRVPSAFSVYSLIDRNEKALDTLEMGIGRLPLAFSVQPQANAVVSSAEKASQTALPVSVWSLVLIGGMMVCAVFLLVSYIRCLREFNTALPVDNDFIQDWLCEHQLKRKIEIRQFAGVLTPLTYGIFRPVILMPKDTDWKNKKQLEYMLSHEYVHICRYDAVLKFFMAAALCIHWFNPMVWLLFVLLNRDIELACDECVVRRFGKNDRAAYARMLINMEERKNRFVPLCSNFSKNAIEERIEAIMKMKKLSLVSLAAAAIIVAGVTTTFATSAAENGNGSTDYDVSVPSGDVASDDLVRVRIDAASDEAAYYIWDVSAEKNKSASVSYDMSADIGEDENVSVWISVDDTNLVLWTYEEFAEYIEYEKQTLPNLIGQKIWEDVDDPNLVWTQEMVDELIRMDEDMLEDIKNGVAVYRTEDANSELQWIKFSCGQNEGWIRNDFLREAVK